MNYKRLLISLALPQLAGFLGSLFTTQAIPNWYATLERPSFNPPNWIFGPVWISLYFLMGISVYLVWQQIETNKKAQQAFWLFWIHLFFNAIWSIIFFGFQSPGLAFIDLVFLWFLIVILLIKFLKINKLAGYLLIPYLLWVSFAGVLNFSIFWLN